ncbi:MAG: osmotically inducible protein OsmC [Chlamydiae bacterium CG10_big_fil_rev_8_21_14_0_10_42_34]|nr:MAG: osmotically inducible protein OsmC [Chlamydiae bacterium CG10_big_fil_rev_8_21_14_0_10_42_34]
MTKMKVFYLGDLHTECTHESGAKIATDAPKDNMGKGEAFSPTDLFAASLATCMVTLMGIMARKLQVELKGLTAEVEKEMTTTGPRRLGKVIVRIRSELSPNSQVREKLEKAALDCPVGLSLHPDVIVEVDFVWGL